MLGDFNDYDGASDALDHVNSAPITNVMLALKRLDPADPADDLVNAAVFVPKGERFTAFWDQDEDMQIDRPHELTSIDHILLSQGLVGQLDAVEIDHDLDPALGTDGFVSDHYWSWCASIWRGRSCSPMSASGWRCCFRTRRGTRVRTRRLPSPTTAPRR